MKFSKKIVLLIVILNVLFTAAILAVFWHTGSEPTITAGGWFAFTGTELWSLSKIKRDEHKSKKESEESK